MFSIVSKESEVVYLKMQYCWTQSVKEVYLLRKLKANSRHRRREVCCGFCFTKWEIGDVIDCRQSVNSSMDKQMALLDSRRRIGLFTT